MSTPKHTPGPWHVGLKPGPMVYGPQGEQIVGLNVMLDRDEVLANAKFIAAAPAMYEALLNLVICPAFNSQVFERDKESHKAWTLARATLAQAESKS